MNSFLTLSTMPHTPIYSTPLGTAPPTAINSLPDYKAVLIRFFPVCSSPSTGVFVVSITVSNKPARAKIWKQSVLNLAR